MDKSCLTRKEVIHNRLRVALLALLTCCLTGCITLPQRQWVATVSRDRFDDSVTKTVTFGLADESHVWQSTWNHYPFVALRNGELRVGVRSGGPVGMPVGDVQIRIDQNPPVTIAVSETPVDLVPKATEDSTVKTAEKAGKNADSARTIHSGAMADFTKILSPFTATTGTKAQDLLKQMARGRRMIFRSVGLNQPASTTGDVPLGAPFLAALKKAGITVEP